MLRTTLDPAACEDKEEEEDPAAAAPDVDGGGATDWEGAVTCALVKVIIYNITILLTKYKQTNKQTISIMKKPFLLTFCQHFE